MSTPEMPIVNRPEVEVIPASQLPTLREDLALMNRLISDLEAICIEAKTLTVLPSWNKDNRRRAGELTAEYKRLVKQGEDTIEPHKVAINNFKKDFITTPENRVTNKGQEIKMVLGSRMADYDRAEERAAFEEKQRKARELQQKEEREAEQKRQRDEEQAKELRKQRVDEIRADLKAGKFGDPKTAKAKRQAEKLLREAGANEEAALAQAAAEEEEAKQKAAEMPSRVRVEPNIPKVAGNVRRITYSAECTDVLNLLLTYKKTGDPHLQAVLLSGLKWSVDKNIALNKALSEAARENIKTGAEDKKHELTPEEFLKRYPFVRIKEDRSF